MIVAVFFIAVGDPTPGVNEQHYLSRLKHFWDPAWCQGDLFLESPDAHFLIVVLAGWTTKFASLPVVAWAGRLLAWSLLAWAWQRLSWAVVPRPWCAVLSASLWLVGMQQGHFAGEWVIGGVESKCFAYVFVLLALTAHLQDRWEAVWVHLGLATALHALVGGWSVLILFALWLREGSRRPTLRSQLPWMALGGFISLAGVAPPIAMNWSTPPEVVAEANRIYVFDRLPHHLAPFSKQPSYYLERTARHVGMLLLLLLSTSWARQLRDTAGNVDAPAEPTAVADRLLRLTAYAWGAALLAACGLLIEAALAASPETAAKLLRYYWFRLTDIAAPLAVAMTATYAISAGLQQKRPIAIGGLIAALLLVIGHLSVPVFKRVTMPVAPADARLASPTDWRDICEWAKENTAADALFLVPRGANSFKWRAHRAEVVNWKDIPQNAADMVEWRRRAYNVYRYPGPDDERWLALSLGALGSTRLKELAAKYGADYALTDRRRHASLPVAYRNGTYVIYDLRREN